MGNILSYKEIWDKANPEKVKAYKTRYRQKNIEKIRAQDRERARLKRLMFPDKVKDTNKKYYKNNVERHMVQAAKQRAKVKNLDFDIDKSDIVIPQFCPILGIAIELGNETVCYTSPTLDRIDGTKGYIKGNVWVISHLANTMKCNATPEQLLNFAKWIIEFF